MKINVQVDLSEFYTEEEGQSFSDEIKNEISSRVKNQVWKDFQDKALEELKLLVNVNVRIHIFNKFINCICLRTVIIVKHKFKFNFSHNFYFLFFRFPNLA